ncbi:hypothetical protein KPB2_5550 [Klebsiella pneumoniae Kb677]|nr:hypothetical protein KPB2_5550 [Klebsiella pneumoniae Kb677]
MSQIVVDSAVSVIKYFPINGTLVMYGGTTAPRKRRGTTAESGFCARPSPCCFLTLGPYDCSVAKADVAVTFTYKRSSSERTSSAASFATAFGNTWGVMAGNTS